MQAAVLKIKNHSNGQRRYGGGRSEPHEGYLGNFQLRHHAPLYGITNVRSVESIFQVATLN
jgi:hypothetical protein